MDETVEIATRTHGQFPNRGNPNTIRATSAAVNSVKRHLRLKRAETRAVRPLISILGTAIVATACLSSSAGIASRFPAGSSQTSRPGSETLQRNTLCAKDERIIFSCVTKRAAKIVSLCASKDLTGARGYLQYRFGVPGKIELEFPRDRKGTQEKFQYTHYFRARFDLTEINFTINGYAYQIFDDYNGEEKPAQTIQRVSMTAPGKPKEVSFTCRTKPKTDYTDLQAVLPGGQE
jgi:hypothetical protein